jgi:hypothetical protein
MECRRVIRYLRIAVTALSLTASALLIALWVRSYHWSDEVGFLPVGRWGITAGSELGTTRFFASENVAIHAYVDTQYIGDFVFDPELIAEPGPLGLRFSLFTSPSVNIPHWFWVFLAASVAALPWISWSSRFRLRTLLIATTFVAVVLGVIVAAT